MDQYLSPGRFIDSDSPEVAAFARATIAGASGDVDKVRRLYAAVRDGITYDPYVNFADPVNFRASGVLAARRGFCVGKSALLAACCRAVGIPARVGYADVRNHMTSPSCTSGSRPTCSSGTPTRSCWSPANGSRRRRRSTRRCARGSASRRSRSTEQTDSLFQPFDRTGRRHMEYLKDRGAFADVPFETMVAEFRATYPTLISEKGISGDFRAEAVAATD